jgi:purine-nucleoside phosphorylase
MIPSVHQVEAAAEAIRRAWPERPRVGIILGSGLGRLTRQIDVETRIGYESIPHLPRPTADGHAGFWVCGRMEGAAVVAVEGRLHGYEGYTPTEVALPVRVMHALGVELLIISNACGGMNPNFRAGDLMIIEDQVNLTFGNPLVGPHDQNPALGYPDMVRPYDPALIARACETARRNNFVAHRGVYVGVLGPNYETRAEYRFFRRLGGDAVGMSTVWEVIVAAQCGMRVLGVSVVTNVARPDCLRPTDAESVIATAAAAEPKVQTIVRAIVAAEPGLSIACEGRHGRQDLAHDDARNRFVQDTRT